MTVKSLKGKIVSTRVNTRDQAEVIYSNFLWSPPQPLSDSLPSSKEDEG